MDGPHKARALSLIITVVATLMLTSCDQQAPPFRGAVVKPPASAPDFALTDQRGQPFRLSEQRGRVVLLFFGYTHCPDVCPLTLAKWAEVHAALGTDAERVRFVFITVDSMRDTPERLREHLAAFHPAFVGLTGEMEELEPVYQAYGVVHEEVAPEGAEEKHNILMHNTSACAVDQDGKLRLRLSVTLTREDIVHDVRQLLRSQQG